jgi:hypothetical protein
MVRVAIQLIPGSLKRRDDWLGLSASRFRGGRNRDKNGVYLGFDVIRTIV